MLQIIVSDRCANIKQIVKQITAKVMKTMANGKRNIGQNLVPYLINL